MIADDFDAIAKRLNDLQHEPESAEPKAPVEPDLPLWLQPIFVQIDADMEAALEAVLEQLRQIEEAAGGLPDDAEMSDCSSSL